MIFPYNPAFDETCSELGSNHWSCMMRSTVSAEILDKLDGPLRFHASVYRALVCWNAIVFIVLFQRIHQIYKNFVPNLFDHVNLNDDSCTLRTELSCTQFSTNTLFPSQTLPFQYHKLSVQGIFFQL